MSYKRQLDMRDSETVRQKDGEKERKIKRKIEKNSSRDSNNERKTE